LSANTLEMMAVEAHKTETEAKAASTSTVSSKVATPAASKTRADDAHGKGCCIVA